MQDQGILMSVKIAGCLMGVYAEAMDVEGSERIWDLMEDSGLKPNASCYKHMVRMHIRMNNTKKAMQIILYYCRIILLEGQLHTDVPW